MLSQSNSNIDGDRYFKSILRRLPNFKYTCSTEQIMSSFSSMFDDKTRWEIDRGWNNLIAIACYDTKLCMTRLNNSQARFGVKFDVIKEKFGYLNLYKQIVVNYRSDYELDELDKHEFSVELHHMYAVIENTSARVCEECGLISHDHSSYIGKSTERRWAWLKAHCQNCRKSRQNAN